MSSHMSGKDSPYPHTDTHTQDKMKSHSVYQIYNTNRFLCCRLLMEDLSSIVVYHITTYDKKLHYAGVGSINKSTLYTTFCTRELHCAHV